MIRVLGFTVTVPDEASARAAADELARRGHLLVAARPVPDSGPERGLPGWWRVHSLAVDPPYDGRLEESRAENAAVAAIARRHRGRAGGTAGPDAEEAIGRFPRDGLLHELDRAAADRIRERIAAAQASVTPSLPPARGLRCGAFRRPAGELRTAVAAAHRAADDAWRGWLSGTTVAGVGELIAAVADRAFPEETTGPQTAGAVPVLAGLAGERRVGDFYRAMALMVLFRMSTAGRRRLAYQAGGPASRPAGETADEAATRAAVAAALPGLVARRDGQGELPELVLAGLCAAAPEAGTGLPAGLDRLARRYAGTAREPLVALIRALGARDTAATRTALAELAAARPDLVDTWQSPGAAVADRALDTLDTVLESELEDTRLPLLAVLLGPGPR